MNMIITCSTAFMFTGDEKWINKARKCFNWFLGQNDLGVQIYNYQTIQADIIKQKLPTNNGGFNAIKFGKTNKKVYTDLTTDHPIDLTRYQVINNYMGRAGLINSGGASGDNDFADATKTAVINKRAGGMGLISGRKAFQRPMEDGIKLLNTIQDVYLSEDVTIA